MEQTPNSKPPDVTDPAIAGTGEPIKRPRKPRLRWLVLAHVAVGLSTGMLVAWDGPALRPGPGAVVFVGIVFCQTSLLGIWGGLGMSSWWKRLQGLIVGMVYLGLLLDFGVGEPFAANHLILSLATGLVAGVLLIVRFSRIRICLTTAAKTAVPRFQFTIRQLLILTFAVACLVSLGKWLGLDLGNVTEPFLLAMIGLVLGAVGLLPVWPVLGTRQPILPSMIAVGFAAGFGFGLASLFTPPAGMAAFWTTITSVEALSLVASLLVVRSCGYRLMRLPSRRTVTKDAVACNSA